MAIAIPLRSPFVRGSNGWLQQTPTLKGPFPFLQRILSSSFAIIHLISGDNASLPDKGGGLDDGGGEVGGFVSCSQDPPNPLQGGHTSEFSPVRGDAVGRGVCTHQNTPQTLVNHNHLQQQQKFAVFLFLLYSCINYFFLIVATKTHENFFLFEYCC